MARPIIVNILANTTQAERALFRLQGAALRATTGFERAGARVQRAGVAMAAAGQRLSRGLTLPIAVAGGAAVKLSVDFERSMSRIRGLVGASERQVKQWSKAVLDLSRRLPQSPQELADALYFIVSAGIPASRAMDVLRASARAAAAGLGETKTVADAVTSAMNAYGHANLSAKRATDILVAAVREGKGEPEELAGAIGKVIAPAEALGVTFDQVAAAMASMTLVGLDANEAATALRGVLTALQRPTAKQTKALKEMGLSLEQVRQTVRERGLLAGMLQLRDGVGKNSEAASALFGNVRALNAFMILTGQNAGNTARIFDSLARSAGSTDKAFDAASKTSDFKLKSALSSLQATGIQLGAALAPTIQAVAAGLARLADALGRLSPQQQKWLVVSLASVAAVGPLLRIVGGLTVGIGKMIVVVGKVAGVLKTVAGAFKALGLVIAINPVALMIAAFAALAVGLVVLYRRSETFRRAVQAVGRALLTAGRWVAEQWPKVRDTVVGAIRVIVGWFGRVGRQGRRVFRPVIAAGRDLGRAFRDVAPTVRAAFGGIVSAARTVARVIGAAWREDVVPAVRTGARLAGAGVRILAGAFRRLTPVVRAVMGVLGPVVQGRLQVISAAFRAAGRIVTAVVRTAFRVVVTVISTAMRVAAAMIRVILAVIRGDWKAAWEGIKAAARAVWDGIKALVRAGLAFVSSIISTALGFIRAVWSAAWGNALAVLRQAWAAIIAAVQGAVNMVRGIIGGLVGAISGVVGAVFAAARSVGSAIWNGIVGAITGIADAIARTIRAALDTAKGLINALIRAYNRIPILPDIPLLAKGGIVTRPTLAVVGEAGPEAVIPLRSPLAQRFVDRRPTEVHITTTVHVHGNANATDIEEVLRRRDRRLRHQLAEAMGV